MFYNALVRKGKLDDTTEADVQAVVNVHNHMNEVTWQKILEWEKIATTKESSYPKLLKFQGRPTDLTPKAAFKHHVFQHPLPLDRHDWVIERSDGTTVRYILDYYYANDSSLHVDVRPALDSIDSIWHRGMQMPISQFLLKNTKFEYLPLLPNKQLKLQLEDSKQVRKSLHHRDTTVIAKQDDDLTPVIIMAHVNKMCRPAQVAVDRCTLDEECTRAALGLTMCMGQHLCPLQHGAVKKSLETDGVDQVLERLHECVAMKLHASKKK